MPEITLRGGEVDGLALHYVTEGRGPGRRPPPRPRRFRGVLAPQHRSRSPTRATVYRARPARLRALGQAARRSTGSATSRAPLHGFLDTPGHRAGLARRPLARRRGGGDLRAHPSHARRSGWRCWRGLVPGFAFGMSLGLSAHRARRGVGEALSLAAAARRALQGGPRPLLPRARRRTRSISSSSTTTRGARAPRRGRRGWRRARHIRADFSTRRADYRRALGDARPAGAARARPPGSRP